MLSLITSAGATGTAAKIRLNIPIEHHHIMPTITYEASPCSVCKAMVAIDTMWRCVRCGQLTCMRHTSKSAMNGGVCKNCFPSLSSFQQQYMKAENEKMDKLFKKGLFNPNALKEF